MQALALQLVHGLDVVEDILYQAIGLDFNKLAVTFEGHHACTILATMLKHQQAFIDFNISWALQAKCAGSGNKVQNACAGQTQQATFWQA